jgi:hypothetical protein
LSTFNLRPVAAISASREVFVRRVRRYVTPILGLLALSVIEVAWVGRARDYRDLTVEVTSSAVAP